MLQYSPVSPITGSAVTKMYRAWYKNYGWAPQPPGQMSRPTTQVWVTAGTAEKNNAKCTFKTNAANHIILYFLNVLIKLINHSLGGMGNTNSIFSQVFVVPRRLVNLNSMLIVSLQEVYCNYTSKVCGGYSALF